MKQKLSLVVGLTAVALSIIIPLNSQRAFASTTPAFPTCSNTYLETWNWPAMLKKQYINGSQNGGGYESFDSNANSYLIYNNVTNYSGVGSPRNMFTVIVGSSANNLTIDVDSASPNHIKLSGTLISNDFGSTSSTLASEPTTVKTYNSEPSGGYGFTAFPSTNLTSPYDLTTNVGCMVVAHNVTYGAAFTANYNKFVSTQDYALTDGSACKATDFGCWIGKAFNAVDDTFASVGIAIVESITNLFAPDGTQIKASFDDFNSFMQAKLGFLVYPITFLVNVFDAFTSTSSWCTQISCVKDFGNLFGSDFTLNLSQPGITMGDYWNWLLLAIRGLTVLTLILAVKNKYKGVVHK